MHPTFYALIAVVLFVMWRRGSVGRGAAARDGEILERMQALTEKLEGGDKVDAKKVQDLAAAPENRPLLYASLEHFEQLGHFPAGHLDPREQGRAALAYWLMHPNEMAGAPESIEFLEAKRRDVGGKDLRFMIYKFQMAEGHWGGRDWLLGVTGPFTGDDKPFAIGAFSRSGDKLDSTDLDELVDWYMGLIGVGD